MRVAVIGAGMAGLTAARRLVLGGHEVDVYERWPGLGGQAATFDIGDGHLVERYYHHLFPSDSDIATLYSELGMPDEIEYLPSTVGFFAEGRLYPFTTPMELLRFPLVSLATRLRMGIAVLRLQRQRSVEPFESVTAAAWIRSNMGNQAWERVWGPMLRAKFGQRAEDLSMAWLWSKLTLRRRIEGDSRGKELLGYPRSSWETLFTRLREEIEGGGGRVLIDRPVAGLDRGPGGRLHLRAGAPDSFRRGHDPRKFEQLPGGEEYDSVLATVPNGVFSALLDPGLRDEVGEGYLGLLDSVEYHEALCLVLELDRRFSPYYWTNVADPAVPFLGLIEHTNFVSPDRYGGRHILYVANYRAPGDPILDEGPDSLLDHYEAGLKAINPAFDRSWIRGRWLFREPDAQPIVTVGYGERVPPLVTGARGLYLANTAQIYPEDRGTNYGVRLGETAASLIDSALA
jgi:protoporphyrinogen oxidase